MHSLSATHLDCNALDLVLTFCVTDADLDALTVPIRRSGWVPRSVLRRNWLHRACHEDAACARRLGDLLDVRWADWIACVRHADAAGLGDAVSRAARCGAHAGLLWSLLTDPRPAIRTQGALLGRTWMLDACRAPRAAGGPPPAGRRAG